MKKMLFLFLLIAGVSHAQKLAVAELQLRIPAGASEELYYAFAEGDRILLSVEEANGYPIGEISVAEYPEIYKYKGQDVKKERNREFIVNHKSIYKFTFSNTATEARTCFLKITRTPSSKDNTNFDTGIKWITTQDTIYNTVDKNVLVGYDTIYSQKLKRVVASQKRYEEVVLDKSQRVDAKTSFGSTRTAVQFSLPKNFTSKDETKKVVAWAYWVGVGEESNEFWKQNRKMIVGAVQGAASYFTTPLGGIAAGALTNLAIPTNGEDVQYALVNESNYKLIEAEKSFKSYDSGKGVTAYKRFTDSDMLQGKFFMTLTNDNLVQPIDVNVKVSAILEHIKYNEEMGTEPEIKPRYEHRKVTTEQIIYVKKPKIK